MSPAFISISFFIFCQLHYLFSSSLHSDLGSILFWPKVCPELLYLCICFFFCTSTYSSAVTMGPAVSSDISVHVCKTAWHPCTDDRLHKVLYLYTACTKNFSPQSCNMWIDAFCHQKKYKQNVHVCNTALTPLDHLWKDTCLIWQQVESPLDSLLHLKSSSFDYTPNRCWCHVLSLQADCLCCQVLPTSSALY